MDRRPLVKTRTICLAALLVCSLALPAFAGDQEKAEKELRMITAMTADPVARSIVNHTTAEFLSMDRIALAKERQDLNLTYGSLFLAHQLVTDTTNMGDIASDLKGGKSIMDIANLRHADWKTIANRARKLNKKLDENLQKSFRDPQAELIRSKADGYDAQADKVAADSGITKQEFEEAQNRYRNLHDSAMQNNLGIDGATKSNTGVPSVSAGKR